MKNIVLFVIDSMNYSHMKKHPDLTPFINELKEKAISFENMYSQAPYTEAAVMNIYCGQNVLDNGGYIRRFADAQATVFEVMREKGYVTYYNAFQPQCYASSLRRGVDHIYNNVGYDLGALWSYRLNLFSDLYLKNMLNDDDYALLFDILNDNFVEWLRFTEEYNQKADSVSMIYGNASNYDAKEIGFKVEAEYEAFLCDKKAYVNALLTQKTSHPLFLISAFFQNKKIKNRDAVKLVQCEMHPLFLEIKKMNRGLNLKNCKGVFKGPLRKLCEFVRRPNINTLKNFAKSIILVRNVFTDVDLFERIADNYDSFKNAPSVKSHIDHYINWENNRDKSKPSFSCIHVDDIHNPEMFFTYDSEDINLIKREISDAKDVIDKIPSTYYGNITHDLSLRYMDSKIRYFYEQLEKNGLLDDTIVVLCADHGFSFAGNPLRDSFVINMYLENYNIPCIITGTDYKKNITSLHASKDIPAIISFLADGKSPVEFNGKNPLVDNDCYENVFIEYCGGGCPYLSRRELKIACFDREYFVATQARLDTNITLADITEVYDLSKDPDQLNNLCKNKYDVQKVEKIFDKIIARRTEIYHQLQKEQA